MIISDAMLQYTDTTEWFQQILALTFDVVNYSGMLMTLVYETQAKATPLGQT